MLAVEKNEKDEEDENPLFTLLPMKLEALPFIADCGAIHDQVNKELLYE